VATDDARFEPNQRKPLGPIARWLAKGPRYLYTMRLGRLLGRRLVLLHHTGRTTGLPRQTVLEVVRHDDTSLDVAAGWGRNSDWYKNLTVQPKIYVDTGPLREVPAIASHVDPATAADVFADYAERHPRAARTLAKTFALPLHDPAAMAATVPLVRLSLQ